MMAAKPISDVTTEDLTNGHGLVYGRCKVWYHDLSDNHEMKWHWSRWAWWKAMHYPHAGPPCYPGTWGVYGGSGGGGYTGRGDAQITHFLPIPAVPDGAPVGGDEA